MSRWTGVPSSLQTRVNNRYTVNGALKTAPGRYLYDEALAQDKGIASVTAGLTRRFMPPGGPYAKSLNTQVYDVPGLGDDSWASVVGNFVGEIGKGLGGKISGNNPYVTAPPVVNAAPPTAPISMGTKLLIGGGVAVGAIVLVSALRR